MAQLAGPSFECLLQGLTLSTGAVENSPRLSGTKLSHSFTRKKTEPAVRDEKNLLSFFYSLRPTLDL